MKFRSLLILIVFMLASVVAGLASLGDAGEQALAELSVANMTCGSCVQNIEAALDSLPGVDTTQISVTTGRSRVLFDPDRIDEEKIAERITAAGYPARVEYVLSAEEYRTVREEKKRLADKFVARIDERLVPRENFQAALELQRHRSGTSMRDQKVLRATWQVLVKREILLGAAEEKSIVVQDEKVQAEIDKMRGAMKGFDKFITRRYGSIGAYMDQLKADLTIKRLIEEESVLSGGEDPAERSRKIQVWYADLAADTDILILDSQLRTAMSQSGGGCGGSCCG